MPEKEDKEKMYQESKEACESILKLLANHNRVSLKSFMLVQKSLKNLHEVLKFSDDIDDILKK